MIDEIVPKILKIKILMAGSRNVTKNISKRNPPKISLLTGSRAGGYAAFRIPQRYVAIKSG
jgi:hypothetical protein